MLIATNSQGWQFVWPTGSDLIEIYNKKASFPDIPVDVIPAGNLKYNDSALRKLANDAREYGRQYNA
jgi:hypothetical protein